MLESWHKTSRVSKEQENNSRNNNRKEKWQNEEQLERKRGSREQHREVITIRYFTWSLNNNEKKPKDTQTESRSTKIC